MTEDGPTGAEEYLQPDLLALATHAAPVGITVADLRQQDLPLIFVSDGFTRITGYPQDEALGRNCRFLQGENTSPATVDEIRRAIENRESFQGAILNYRKDGTPFWNRLSLTPASTDGVITHYVGIQEDVTEIRRARSEGSHLRRLAELGSFAGVIAHDFNNLLMEIQGRVEISEDSGWDEEVVAEEVPQIAASVERGSNLIGELLRFAREPDHQELTEQPSTLVRDLITSVTRFLPSRVKLKVSFPKDLVYVAIPRAELEQVILNLAKNAADAMPSGGTLTIDLEEDRERESAVLAISDQGEGMSASVQQEAFKPFFTTKGSSGTGLGLSSVTRIVERAGGSIQLSSEIGKGTTFRLRLPLALSTEGAAPPSELVQNVPSERGRALEGLRVLVAEDQPAIRNVVGRLLRRHGLQVVTAGDGIEARQEIQNAHRPFDIIIADRDMPGLTGDHLLQQIPGLTASWPQPPRMILMSGDLSAVVRDLPPGVVSLEKPFKISSLMDSVRGLVVRERGAAG